MAGFIFSRREKCTASPKVIFIWLITLTKQAYGNYSVIAPFVDAVPPSATKIKQSLDWNYDLRWNERLQWDVGHSSCWDVDFSVYYSSSLHHRWESCRLTAAYLNTKLAEEKQFFKTSTCCYIKCALHWTGWVNDDYSFNEARGENIARDIMKPIRFATFSRLMEEYRKCSKLYKYPFGPDCMENLEFARCHIQAFNNMCDQNIDTRVPYPRQEPRWAMAMTKHTNSKVGVQKSNHEVKNSENEKPNLKTKDSKAGEENSNNPVRYGRAFARNLKNKRSTTPVPSSAIDNSKARNANRVGASGTAESTDHDSTTTTQKKRTPWLTTGHFCTDLCQSACSINDNLYTD